MQCEGGYIHAGLRKMIQAISGVSQKHKLEVSEGVDDFEGLSFCGPRIVNSPGNTQDATKLCQLLFHTNMLCSVSILLCTGF